jgi:hypothetical protein
LEGVGLVEKSENEGLYSEKMREQRDGLVLTGVVVERDSNLFGVVRVEG